MARTIEARLASLRALAKLDPTAVTELRDALASASGLLIAAATRRVVELGAESLINELPKAFTRLCERPVQRDAGCRGKIAIVRALHELDRWDAAFERGVRYVQPEPGWGGSTDTAAELRAVCGLAHAHFARPDALDVLADLLADAERTPREAAARGLGDSGHIDAAALLRFKLHVGDPEPEVLSACCESLFVLQRAGAVAFVARLLEAGDEVRAEIAAVALGASRLEAALPPLNAWCNRVAPALRRRIGYLALALSRTDATTARLLEIVRTGEPADALAAAGALATFKDDPNLRDRLGAAGRDRRDVTREQIALLLE